jgi:hypothetical protein
MNTHVKVLPKFSHKIMCENTWKYLGMGEIRKSFYKEQNDFTKLWNKTACRGVVDKN